MISYYIIFFLPFLGLFNSNKFNKSTSFFFIYTYLFLLVLFIGFRHEVGGDWAQYIHNYRNQTLFDFFNLSIRNDYLYKYISFVFYKFGLSYHFLNFFLSIFFVLSIYKFGQLQPSLALSFIISFPIIILIMGMGFDRQGIAFAFILFAMTAFIKEQKINFLFFSFLAIFFHKSAIFILLLYPLINRYINIYEMIFICLTILFIIVLLRTDLINLYNNYIGENLYSNAEESSQLVSKGAPYRIGLNLIASGIFLIFYKEISNNINEKKLFLFLSICIFLIFLLSFKYAVFSDRINYYFSAIQIIVFSRIPFLFSNKMTRVLIILSISLFYILILFVWLNYAEYAHAWLPYQNILVK